MKATSFNPNRELVSQNIGMDPTSSVPSPLEMLKTSAANSEPSTTHLFILNFLSICLFMGYFRCFKIVLSDSKMFSAFCQIVARYFKFLELTIQSVITLRTTTNGSNNT